MNITIRTIKMIQKQVPLLLPLTLIYSLFFIMKPFVIFQFSGMIVNELYESRELRKVFITVGIFVLVVLVNDLIIAFLAGRKNVLIATLTYKQDLMLAKTAMNIDYDKLENSDIQTLLENIKQSKFQRGDFFLTEIHLIEKFLIGIFTITAALIQIPKIILIDTSVLGIPSLVMTMTLFALFSILSWLSILSAKNSIRHSKNVFARFGEVAGVNRIFGFYRKEIFQNYRYGKDIRIFGEQELINHEFDECKNTVRKFMEGLGDEEGRFRVKNTIITTSVIGIVYLFVGLEAYYGMIRIGDVVKYVGIISQFLIGINDNVRAVIDLELNRKFLEQYYKFLDMNGEHNKNNFSINTIKEVLNGDFEIEFHDVSFQYPNAEKWAIRNLSFRMRKGEHIGVVGENGSGKTTCIRLLCRLYKPTSGMITINGIDIQTYPFEDYVHLLSVVFQDFKLFSIKLSENLTVSDNVDRKKVMEVLEDTDMLSRINSMQGGIDTYLYYDFSSNGVELSGGEAQKIAIAKALYKNAPLFIMDEPTAALDAMAEAEIYRGFHTMMVDKTFLVISHRLSSCIFCDRILVFCEGELVEDGSHTQLLLEEGIYKKLWHAQAENYKERVTI
ncbi:MAG: ABC transporter ATP-binding protein [Acetivibrio ethanolgignens]